MMMGSVPPPKPLKPQRAEYCSEVELGEAQWINCDIRTFRMDIIGQFGVIMADPPWDIHMELPYGTMSDDEMRNLNVPALQTDGLIFLWVTGRAMELGREWYFCSFVNFSKRSLDFSNFFPDNFNTTTMLVHNLAGFLLFMLN